MFLPRASIGGEDWTIGKSDVDLLQRQFPTEEKQHVLDRSGAVSSHARTSFAAKIGFYLFAALTAYQVNPIKPKFKLPLTYS